MMQCPTWKEFIEQLEKLHVQCKTTSGKLPGGNRAIEAKYFEHKMDGQVYRCEVAFTDENERVLPSVIKYVLRRLAIHPSLYGFELG